MRVVRGRTTSRIIKEGTSGAITVSEADEYITNFYNTHDAMEDADFDFIGLVLGHLNDKQKEDLMNDLLGIAEYRQENGID